MNIHIISRIKDARFLSKERRDPATYAAFKEGDRVVICGKCAMPDIRNATVQLEKTWQEANSSMGKPANSCYKCHSSISKEMSSLDPIVAAKPVKRIQKVSGTTTRTNTGSTSTTRSSNGTTTRTTTTTTTTRQRTSSSSSGSTPPPSKSSGGIIWWIILVIAACLIISKISESYSAAQNINSQYEVVFADATWSEAYENAQSSGGRLVTVNSHEEFEKVCDLADSYGLKVVLAGAVRNSGEDWTETQWIDGEPMEYTNWYQGEPTYYSSNGNEERCLILFKVGDSWYFNDAEDDIIRYYSGRMGYIVEQEG